MSQNVDAKHRASNALLFPSMYGRSIIWWKTSNDTNLNYIRFNVRGVSSEGETPVPIPNTAVKLFSVDGSEN